MNSTDTDTVRNSLMDVETDTTSRTILPDTSESLSSVVDSEGQSSGLSKHDSKTSSGESTNETTETTSESELSSSSGSSSTQASSSINTSSSVSTGSIETSTATTQSSYTALLSSSSSSSSPSSSSSEFPGFSETSAKSTSASTKPKTSASVTKSVSESSNTRSILSVSTSLGHFSSNSSSSNFSPTTTLEANGYIFSNFTDINIIGEGTSASSNAYIDHSTHVSSTGSSLLTNSGKTNIVSSTTHVESSSFTTESIETLDGYDTWTGYTTTDTPTSDLDAATTTQSLTDIHTSVFEYVQVYEITDATTTFKCSLGTTEKPKHSVITTNYKYYASTLKNLIDAESSNFQLSGDVHSNSHKTLIKNLVGGIVGGVAGLFIILLLGYYAYKSRSRKGKKIYSNENFAETGFSHGQGRKINIFEEKDLLKYYTVQNNTETLTKENDINEFDNVNQKASTNPFKEEFDFTNRMFSLNKEDPISEKKTSTVPVCIPPIIVESSAAEILRGSSAQETSFSSSDDSDYNISRTFNDTHEEERNPFADPYPTEIRNSFDSGDTYSNMSSDITSLAPNSRPPSEGMFTERV